MIATKGDYLVVGWWSWGGRGGQKAGLLDVFLLRAEAVGDRPCL